MGLNHTIPMIFFFGVTPWAVPLKHFSQVLQNVPTQNSYSTIITERYMKSASTIEQNVWHARLRDTKALCVVLITTIL
jgi:hypothetical protein